MADNRGVQQLDIHIDEDNMASRKCLEGLGADYIRMEGSRYYRLAIPVL